MKPTLKAPGTKLLKLKFDQPLSSFAFKFNLRRYTEVLSVHFGASAECFASPLNHHYAHYFSAFPDTDRWFGSRGSFFENFPKEGSFECNPPFAGLSAGAYTLPSLSST